MFCDWNSMDLARLGPVLFLYSTTSKLERALALKRNDLNPQAFWGSATETLEDVPISQLDSNGTAWITFEGVTRPSRPWWSRTPGMNELIEEIERLEASESVKRTVISGTSGGGSGFRVHDLYATIEHHASSKPIYGYVRDMGASAFFWFLSACTAIYCDSATEAGGLGAFMILKDTSKLFEDMGITETLVVDTPAGVKGLDALAEVDQRLVADKERTLASQSKIFRGDVSKGRGLRDGDVDALFDGRTWIGEEALNRGLVDGLFTSRQFREFVGEGRLDQETGMRRRLTAFPHTTEEGKDRDMPESEPNAMAKWLRTGSKLFNFGGAHAVAPAAGAQGAPPEADPPQNATTAAPAAPSVAAADVVSPPAPATIPAPIPAPAPTVAQGAAVLPSLAPSATIPRPGVELSHRAAVDLIMSCARTGIINEVESTVQMLGLPGVTTETPGFSHALCSLYALQLCETAARGEALPDKHSHIKMLVDVLGNGSDVTAVCTMLFRGSSPFDTVVKAFQNFPRFALSLGDANLATAALGQQGQPPMGGGQDRTRNEGEGGSQSEPTRTMAEFPQTVNAEYGVPDKK